MVDIFLVRIIFLSLAILLYDTDFCLAYTENIEKESLDDEVEPPQTSNDVTGDGLKDNDFFSTLVEDTLTRDQSELLHAKNSDIKLHLGPVFPWQDVGLGTSWKKEAGDFWGLGFGKGKFLIQKQISGIDFKISSEIESVYASYWHYFETLPFVFTAYAGLNTWSGHIRPMGFDFSESASSASLNSDFSHISLSLGVKVSFFWQWENNLAFEASVFDLSSGFYVKESYTTNISSARNSLRESLNGPNVFPGFQLSLVYWFAEDSD